MNDWRSKVKGFVCGHLRCSEVLTARLFNEEERRQVYIERIWRTPSAHCASDRTGESNFDQELRYPKMLYPNREVPKSGDFGHEPQIRFCPLCKVHHAPIRIFGLSSKVGTGMFCHSLNLM